MPDNACTSTLHQILLSLNQHRSYDSRKYRTIAIIGAGAAGLICGYILRTAGFDVKIFEETDSIGGIWKSHPGTAMYSSLRTNLPKEIMAFNLENPFIAENVFHQSLPSFIGPETVQEYLENFTKVHSLHEIISFNTKVTTVSKDEGHWNVQYQNMQSLELSTEDFDSIVVCNGHFSIPQMPFVKGLQENFLGKIFHSKDYETLKNQNLFQNKKILVIGTKSSGTDISRELSQPSLGNIIYVSDRNCIPSQSSPSPCPFITKDSRTIFYFPQLQECSSDDHSLLFSDQSRLNADEVDYIIFCTGYLYDYPFFPEILSENSSSSSSFPVHLDDQQRRLTPLHRLMISIEDPSLVFIGLPFLVIPFPLFYYQILFVCVFWLNLLPNYPSKESQYSQLAAYEESFLGKNQLSMPQASYYQTGKYHFLGNEQFPYYRKLLGDAFEAILSFFSATAGSPTISSPSPTPSTTSSSTETPVNLSPRVSVDDIKAVYAREQRYLQIIQEIYFDNTHHRPKFVGDLDDYRERQYFIDR